MIVSRKNIRGFFVSGIATVSWLAGMGIGTQSTLAAQFILEEVASGLTNPLYITHAPGERDQLFVVELNGKIKVIDRNTGIINPEPFLDLSSSTSSLRSMAFHPDFAKNGFFYVGLTTQEVEGSTTSQVIRYTASQDLNTAEPNSEEIVLSIPDASGLHPIGWIGFGPDDKLYIGHGDAVRRANGQNPNTLPGSILRLDVDSDDFQSDPNRNYAIPQDNPFVDSDEGADEVWAYGLRQPWRSSFDRETGDFYIGDVGESTREEINFQPASSSGGENYGWAVREGFIPTPNFTGGPKTPDMVDPIYDYEHGDGANEGRSVIGGYVYRGPITQLQGLYFFADFGNSRLWSLDTNNNFEFRDWTEDLKDPTTPSGVARVRSFGEDADGNLYLASRSSILRLRATPVPEPLTILGSATALGFGALLKREHSKKQKKD
ncbi:PEP-CTERM sorting domain-containing protein [Coleofasciculus sp. G2-EDA-02]|uniref:PEP-CTERM sorting domain-containing protein n=1 Tax=Coleofasciculus sp. G2-EDA-02 TaxID=3069529 RepID=UPI0032FDDFC6